MRKKGLWRFLIIALALSTIGSWMAWQTEAATPIRSWRAPNGIERFYVRAAYKGVVYGNSEVYYTWPRWNIVKLDAATGTVLGKYGDDRDSSSYSFAFSDGVYAYSGNYFVPNVDVAFNRVGMTAPLHANHYGAGYTHFAGFQGSLYFLCPNMQDGHPGFNLFKLTGQTETSIANIKEYSGNEGFGFVIDSTGKFYLCKYNKVYIYSPAGVLIETRDTGIELGNLLLDNNNIWLDRNENLYYRLSDQTSSGVNNRIIKFNKNGIKEAEIVIPKKENMQIAHICVGDDGFAYVTYWEYDSSVDKYVANVDVYSIANEQSTIPVTGVLLSDHTMELAVDEKKQLTYTITPSNATNQAVQWRTDASDIAEVSNVGILTGLKPGKTYVTVQTKDGGFTDTCEITVSSDKWHVVNTINLGDLTVEQLRNGHKEDFRPWFRQNPAGTGFLPEGTIIVDNIPIDTELSFPYVSMIDDPALTMNFSPIFGGITFPYTVSRFADRLGDVGFNIAENQAIKPGNHTAKLTFNGKKTDGTLGKWDVYYQFNVVEYEDLMLAAVFSDMVYNEDLSLRSNVREYAKVASNRNTKIWKSKSITFADWYSEVAGDWIIVAGSIVSNPTTSFQAATFDSLDGKRRIIAYRGTQEKQDFLTDLRLFLVQMDRQLEGANSYFEIFGEKTEREVLLVGHSLGGALAGYVSMLTGVRAITINGATGLAIDVAYKKEHLKLALAFTGVEKWNFTNHVTDKLININTAIVCTNNTQYDFFKYPFNPDTNRNFLMDEHAPTAFISFNDTEKKFIVNRPGVRVGDKTGGPKKIKNNFNFFFGEYFTLDLGTTGKDKLKHEYELKVIPQPPFILWERATYAFGGDGDDEIATSAKGDVLVGGRGTNTLDSKEGNDIFLITDGDYIIRDPSGYDKIILLNGVRVSGAFEEDTFYTVNLTNGHFIKVMKFRNFFFFDGSISVVDEKGATLGKIGGGRAWTSKGLEVHTAKIAEKAIDVFPTTKRVIIEGSVSAFRVCDENGELIETFVNNDNTNVYREYGYFYMQSGTNPSITAILINGNYNIKVEGEKAVKYGIVNFDTNDTPVVLLSTEVPLKSGVYLDTRSNFGLDNEVPFVIRDIETGEEITRLNPDVADLTEEDNEENETEISIDLSDLRLVNGKLILQPGEEVDVTITGTPEGLKFNATGLPQGLTLTENGHLYGKVPLVGEYSVTLTVSAPDGTEKITSFTVVVAADNVTVEDNGGSGGCNTGLGVLALVALLLLKHRMR